MKTNLGFLGFLVIKQPAEIPIGADVLCVRLQDNTTCLWAMIDPNLTGKEKRKKKTTVTYGTGCRLGPDNILVQTQDNVYYEISG